MTPKIKDKDKVKENVTNPLNDDNYIFIPSECSPPPIKFSLTDTITSRNNSLYQQKEKSAL